MILKSCLLLFAVFTLEIHCAKLDSTYSDLANGWLKFHKAATWSDASIICDLEDSVLASPTTSQLRDALKDYVKLRVDESVTTIHTGVHADLTTGDFISIDGVSLTKMPVILEENAPVDYQSSESCVALAQDYTTVKFVKCTEKLPFVCYKKRHSVTVLGCGTLDPEYKYEARSGSCYKFHVKGQTWSKAYKTCRSEGAYLAISNSKLEHVVLNGIYARYPDHLITSSGWEQAYVGMRDWLDGESWKTVKGESLEEAGFTGWDSGEPNNGGGLEHCGAIYRRGPFNDANCYGMLPFICEKEPEILINKIK